ncbi:hypothetical protein NQ317_003634 [Molorchus minor]|uniref:PID domain-containing protein n=1 Tax=Molorchus minor TaxID=1323400 RepID=A0ABQ9ITL0_9CUCU|nr:hypothetical protein NQ317_003634 [Molorchus minor]
MVMCNMENAAIPPPPALPLGPLVPSLGPIPLHKSSRRSQRSGVSRTASIKSRISTSLQGFRLVENNPQNNDETGSVYSIYKQKIDAMFESDSSSTQNSVQAKIEKMFSEVAKDNGIPLNDIGVHNFSVDYLGSIPLHNKVTSLAGLQDPLKELYFKYKKITKTKKPLTGRLEISNVGLKVQYQGEKGDLEQLNSFPTIAVWSAVKFVIHKADDPTYAFLPLITDPDNMDKQALFKTLNDSEKKYITNESHSPLFAVVMRKIGVHKQLECHGFVCQTSEDAIVIAATLYKSLVAHMKAKERRPRNRNGVTTCMSVASSSYRDKSSTSVPVRPPRKKRSTTSSVISETENSNIADTQPLLSSSDKPPKKSIKTKKAPPTPPKRNENLDAILPYEEPIIISDNDISGETKTQEEEEFKEIKPKKIADTISTCMSREQRQLTDEIKQMMSEGGPKCLKKVQSVREGEETLRKKEKSGDILTKVTIPRSGSFLNAGGLTRYKNKVSRNNEQASGGSPLGFKEIFNELSLQEGLHSLDDILGVIIDPDGMSFNDLKPIYKEFLLKLSLTLTKDELLRKKLKKTRVKGHSERPPQLRGKPPDSSISTSSYDTRQFRTKEELRKQGHRKKNSDIGRRRKDRLGSTSDESDCFSSHRSKVKSQSLNLTHNQNRNSSSGYVSCSECSYDSDSCTCVSADKCYCSLGHKNISRPSRCGSTNCKSEERCYCSVDITFCECDTDSCAESNKCYCQNIVRNRNILEQLKQRGFNPHEEQHKHKKLCKKYSNTKSTKSLEYILNPSEAYYEKLKSKSKFDSQRNGNYVEYEPFSMANGSIKELENLKNLQKSFLYSRGYCERNGGFGICKQNSSSNWESTKSRGLSSKGLQSTAISTGGCSEALAVKKSAEIAAIFADVNLSQTTDITHLYSEKFQHGFIGLVLRLAKTALGTVKGNMYNAKNGLYTIQSQSDESRRSSLSEGRKIDSKKRLF